MLTGSVRPSPEVKLITNVTSALHTSATLSISIQAYPVPSQSNFTWMKCVRQCNDLQTYDAINITTVELMTKLTIFDVNEEDFGIYKLAVTNGIGEQMIQEFYLLPQGTNMASKEAFINTEPSNCL